MKPSKFSPLALVLLLLAACGQAPQPQTGAQSDAANSSAPATSATTHAAPTSILSGAVQQAMQEAKEKLATENISVNRVHGAHSRSGRQDTKDPRPKAEITPQGELLIAGKKVDATPAQQNLLLDYRAQIIGIAEAGMDIGTQGADLGMHAAKQALWGALSGQSDEAIEAAIKPQTDKIKAATLKLCQRLPGLLTSQQQLAAAMPAFRPYATLQEQDVDDCGKHMADREDQQGAAVSAD